MDRFKETDVKLDLSDQVPKPPTFARLERNQKDNEELIEYLEKVTDQKENS